MIYVIPILFVIGVLAWVLRPGRRPARPCRLAVLATVILPGVFALAAIVFQFLYNAVGNVLVSDISNTLYIAGFSFIGAAILVLAVFALKRNGEVAKGMGFGLSIAVIVYIIEFGLLEWMAGV